VGFNPAYITVLGSFDSEGYVIPYSNPALSEPRGPYLMGSNQPFDTFLAYLIEYTDTSLWGAMVLRILAPFIFIMPAAQLVFLTGSEEERKDRSALFSIFGCCSVLFVVAIFYGLAEAIGLASADKNLGGCSSYSKAPLHHYTYIIHLSLSPFYSRFAYPPRFARHCSLLFVTQETQ
jgi:hypothetical protein